MRIAFYAPMKSPEHPEPSGDRRMAGLLMKALRIAGHDVRLASDFRTYDGEGDASRQRRDARSGMGLARKFVAEHAANPPDLWFTYHLYHKAPDWLGPVIARRFSIPYVVAEASHAPKQRLGPWRIGHGAAAAALRRADRVISVNPRDEPCLRALLGGGQRLTRLRPFIDGPPPPAERDPARRDLARRLDLDPQAAWLLTVAMMRPGNKLASYRILGDAARKWTHPRWQLLIAGDGPARGAAERAFEDTERVRFLGRRDSAELSHLAAAADLFVWPAVKEGYGMALLEAQAAGLPVVAGETPGVASIVADGKTGSLTPQNDADAFAGAVDGLLDDPDRRAGYAAAARCKAAREHDISSAAGHLADVLHSLETTVPA